MRVLGIGDSNSVKVKEGVKLPEFIRTITVETAKEEQEIRLFLTGALSIDNGGCHELGRSFEGVEFDSRFHHDPDTHDGSNYRAGANNKSQGLDDKLRILEALTTALNYGENIDDDNRKLLSEKLKSIVESL